MARPNFAELRAERIEDNEMVQIRMEGLKLISNGVFSNVYQGKLTEPEETTIVVKKTWSKDGIARTREVVILDMLKKRYHKNIIQLFYVFSTRHPKDLVCYGLVFEYMPLTLLNYVKTYGRHEDGVRKINLVDAKLFTWQLFRGQDHLTKLKICHRDIKPQNLLVDSATGMLKISDFGSSKIMDENARSASYQVTRYYRPPELLMDATIYSTNIDIWSCGCVFGELLKGNVLLHGRNTYNQLELIIECLGIPTKADIIAMKCNSNFTKNDNFLQEAIIARHNRASPFARLLPDASVSAVQLINRVLVYNPNRRLSGKEFLRNPFFREIFSQAAIRTNNRIVDCLTRQDLEDALNDQ